MPGPTAKHPSVRRRRNSKPDFESLPLAGRSGKAPPWPLLPDVSVVAERDLAVEKLAALTVEIEAVQDGRTKGRIRRRLDAAELSVAVLSRQVEQSVAAELQLWSMLWATPQATMWESSLAFARLLAQFVRWNVRAEQGDLRAAVEARLRAADFGLTPKSLQQLKAEVERADEAEARGLRRRSVARPPKATPEADPRSFLSVVG